MSKGPGLFTDIGKKAKDLLTRDYLSDHKFSVSTYSESGVVFDSSVEPGACAFVEVNKKYI